MANKRMFTMKICDSDAFLDMPLSTQCLYFHLNMRADDDGFIDNPKRIMRIVGASDDDLKILIGKNFVLAFESGVLVIKHWRMHNTLSNSRYHETQYLEEKNELLLKDNGSYSLTDGNPLNDKKTAEMFRLSDKRRTSGGQAEDTDIDIDKDIDKDLDLEKTNKRKIAIYFPSDEYLNSAFSDYVDMRKKIKAPMTARAIELAIGQLNKMTDDNDEKIEILNQSIINSWKGLFPLKRQEQRAQSIADKWANA